MIKIAVLTATRAEYGLLSSIIKKMKKDPFFDVRVIVTGAHLSPEFGLTYNEIVNDGIDIDKKIDILLSADTPSAISKSMGLAMMGFADYFSDYKPDFLMVLGDRYETLAVCCAAMNAQIPIIHLYGGETTEGAVDEAIRHSITKMSYYHFVSTEIYRKRVIQLGEDPERVFCVGAMGVENALDIPLLTKKELELSLGIPLERPYAVVTFHPVTLEENSAEQQTKELLLAIENYQEYDFIVTKANADTNGRIINKMMEDFAKQNANIHVFASLGMKRYLSAVKYSEFVLGNSSSGIVEVPALGIPTVNVGDRQKGRIMSDSVISCKTEYKVICESIERAINMTRKVSSVYGDGKTSDKIISTIKNVTKEGMPNLKKQFYDI